MDEAYNARNDGLTSLEPPLRVAITGGTAGLGLALMREFRARGAEIAFVARHRERLQRVAADEARVFDRAEAADDTGLAGVS